jgi:hypothetical protein
VRTEGIDAAFGWAEELADDAPGRFKLQAYRRVATAVAEIDPWRAAAWTETKLDGEFGDHLARRVTMVWVKRDPAAAMTWLGDLPPEAVEDAIGETYRDWLVQDRESALAWFGELEPPARSDAVIATYALAIALAEPRAAIEWAEQLPAGEPRDRTLESIARSWLQNDRSAATDWIEASDLPAERKQRLLRPEPARSPLPR